MCEWVLKLPEGEVGISREERLIASIERLWAGRGNVGVSLAGGDDCAILHLPGIGDDLLVTSDQIVENRHFVRGRHPPRALGRKALVRSLSDIAAMGGSPLWCLQTVSLPDWATGRWHEEFQRGLLDAADVPDASDLALVGGDVSGGDRFVSTVTVIGRVKHGTAVLRSGARPGDVVYVSGLLGGSALGLELLLGEGHTDRDAAVLRHCEPSARLALGRALRRVPATAMIDLSDGLATDANRLASASGVALVLDQAAVPLFPGASARVALSSGEEYELLCTISPEREAPAGTDLTPIGRVESGTGVWLLSTSGREPLRALGYAHF